LLVDVGKDSAYVAAELRNVARMQAGELGWVGQFFGGHETLNGTQLPSRIEVAVGSVLNTDALTFGSVMAPLTNPFAFRSNGNAMGGMLAMLSLADPDMVVDNLRSMTMPRSSRLVASRCMRTTSQRAAIPLLFC
jgi:hypothetical protein